MWYLLMQLQLLIVIIYTSPLQKLYSQSNAQDNQHAMLRPWVAQIHTCLQNTT